MNVHSGLKNPAVEAAEQLQRMLIARGNVEVLLMLSGGASMKILEHVEEGLGQNVLVTMLDDRFNEDPKVNNFAQLMEHPFTQKCVKSGCYIFGTQVNAKETFAEYGQRYERMIANWLEQNPEGVVIAVMGVGEDGHTAGILPHPEKPQVFNMLFEEPDDISVTYDANGKHEFPLRLTVVNDFLRRKVDYAIMYAEGEGDREALEAIIAEAGELHVTPGRIVREMQDVQIFTDITLKH
jgi:6-phosphogluconolactonase/glucosamine-6-phosphate isomerase/deaminase